MICRTRLLIAVVICIGLGIFRISSAQEIVIVKVKSFGQGMTEAAAIKDAIVEAIGRVSGERISSSSQSQTKSEESTSGKSNHSVSFEQRIDSLIRGVVKSSTTLSVYRDPIAGVYKAEVEVGVATFKQSEQLNRVKLAVVMGNQPLPRALGESTSTFSQALINGVSDKLVGSRKFAVLDRQQRDVAQREFSRITSGGTPVENFVRLQSGAVADFLVVVDVSDYAPGRSTLGKDTTRATARAMVYDYTSGQIRQAVTASSKSVLRDGSAMELAVQLGGDLAEQIIESVFPAQVIAIEAGNPIINAGFGQFEVGDPVDVFKRGQALLDPYTKERLGHSEVLIGQATVEFVMPRASSIKFAGEVRIAGLQNATYIVRRRSFETAPPSKPKGPKHDDW
ncbi:MAG: hypothetical protein EBT07_06850 [Actinobacteria bacterium]|nr:hypothetical protein [Actinomycetota bacterium]